MENNHGAPFLVILQLVTELSCNAKAKKWKFIHLFNGTEHRASSIECLVFIIRQVLYCPFVVIFSFLFQLSTSSCLCYFCWYGLFAIFSWIFSFIFSGFAQQRKKRELKRPCLLSFIKHYSHTNRGALDGSLLKYLCLCTKYEVRSNHCFVEKWQ